MGNILIIILTLVLNVVSVSAETLSPYQVPPTEANGPKIDRYVQPSVQLVPPTSSPWIMPLPDYKSKIKSDSTNNKKNSIDFCSIPTYKYFIQGTQSEYIESLQSILFFDVGFSYQSTGYFGPITEKAVKKYQAKYGITSADFIGPKTYKHMYQNWCTK